VPMLSELLNPVNQNMVAVHLNVYEGYTCVTTHKHIYVYINFNVYIKYII
jgi:hypothetical protein